MTTGASHPSLPFPDSLPQPLALAIDSALGPRTKSATCHASPKAPSLLALSAPTGGTTYLKADSLHVDSTCCQRSCCIIPTSPGQLCHYTIRSCPLSAPMSAGEIARLALARGFIRVQGKTPEATMASALYTDVKRKGGEGTFVRPQEGLFGLRAWRHLPVRIPVLLHMLLYCCVSHRAVGPIIRQWAQAGRSSAFEPCDLSAARSAARLSRVPQSKGSAVLACCCQACRVLACRVLA